MIINHIEGAEARALIQHSTHKVRRPYLVSLLRDEQWFSGPIREFAPDATRLIQSHATIISANPHAIPTDALVMDCIHNLPETPAGVCLDQFIQHSNDLRIPFHPIQRLSIKCTMGQAHAGAPSPHR